MKPITPPRKLLAATALATLIATGAPAFADDAAPAPAAELDAAPATVDVPPGPVIVDTEAGTVTPATGTPADRITKDPVGVAQETVQAVKSGNWKLVVATALGAIMVLGIRFGGRLFPKTQRGKAAYLMTLALAGTLSTALSTGAAITLNLFVGALSVAWLAVGAREWIATLLWPKDGKHVLTWLKPILGK